MDIPDEIIFSPTRLPRGWEATPHTEISQRFGSRSLRAHAVMRVPSVVVPGEFCFVFNPLYSDFRKMKIGRPESLVFDPRVISGQRKPDAA